MRRKNSGEGWWVKGSGEARGEDLDPGSCFRARMTKTHTMCKWGRGRASSPSWYQLLVWPGKPQQSSRPAVSSSVGGQRCREWCPSIKWLIGSRLQWCGPWRITWSDWLLSTIPMAGGGGCVCDIMRGARAGVVSRGQVCVSRGQAGSWFRS